MNDVPLSSLTLATRNAHKAREIQALLGAGFRFLTLSDFPNAPLVTEDQPTFEGNAAKKAVSLARWMGGTWPEAQRPARVYVLADDSGLEVDALSGAPGVHSARFAALDSGGMGNAPDAENNAKLLRLLEGVPLERRTARFRCVIALTPVFREPAGMPPRFATPMNLICRHACSKAPAKDESPSSQKARTVSAMIPCSCPTGYCGHSLNCLRKRRIV